MSNWRKAFCSPRASWPNATTSWPCATAAAPMWTGSTATTFSTSRWPRRFPPRMWTPPATSIRHRHAECAARRPWRRCGWSASTAPATTRPPSPLRRCRSCQANCANNRRFSPPPADCTAPRCSPPTVLCWWCVRTSADTTRWTRSSGGPSSSAASRCPGRCCSSVAGRRSS